MISDEALQMLDALRQSSEQRDRELKVIADQCAAAMIKLEKIGDLSATAATLLRRVAEIAERRPDALPPALAADLRDFCAAWREATTN